VQEVFTEIKHFAGSQVFTDDVCLVGMEIARISGQDPELALFGSPALREGAPV
jgi:hypothetical protein